METLELAKAFQKFQQTRRPPSPSLSMLFYSNLAQANNGTPQNNILNNDFLAMTFLPYKHPETGMSLILSGLWPLAIAPCCHHQRCQCYHLVAGCKALCCREGESLVTNIRDCSVLFEGLGTLGFSSMLFLAGCLSFGSLRLSIETNFVLLQLYQGPLHSAGNSRTYSLFRAPT